MKRIRSATINGKRWRIDWSRPEFDDPGEESWALCHHDQLTIQIDPCADDRTILSCLLDEVCHAHFPALDNDYVDQFSDDLAEILVKADLIKQEDDE